MKNGRLRAKNSPVFRPETTFDRIFFGPQSSVRTAVEWVIIASVGFAIITDIVAHAW